MSDSAPVVWIDEGGSRSDAVRALGEWARARDVKLVAPAEPPPALHADPRLADQVEHDLEEASLAIGAADAEATERALTRAEGILRQHPEIVQAAWLRAEVERGWAARFRRVEPRDEARARAAWENADALDGGRLPGIGEAASRPRARVATVLVVMGAGERLALRFDGRQLEAAERDSNETVFRTEAAPADHHVVVMAGNAIVFAGWLPTAGAEASPSRVTLEDGAACRRDQFADVRRDGERVDAANVACAHWLAAAMGEANGSVKVARCEGERCGPFVEWRSFGSSMPAPPLATSVDAHRSKWPAWATWTLVGVGVAAAASAAVIASGAFDERPVVQRFVLGGAKQE